MTEQIADMHATPSANRIHIGFFGCRNAGKSSLVNALTNQPLAVVSDVKGTTTDPVLKAMELLPLGPVVIIDTPGYDDQGDLGSLRVQKTRQVLNRVDIAILVVDGTKGMNDKDRELWDRIQKKGIPSLIVYTKKDLLAADAPVPSLCVSTTTKENMEYLKEQIGQLKKEINQDQVLLEDLIHAKETVVLVIPIDESAPKGRLILPQQLVLRNLLDIGAIGLTCQPEQLQATLQSLKEKPALVITDSQAFDQVKDLVDPSIPLTSFSILLARNKGFLVSAVQGVRAIFSLQDQDRVLMAEGCTHHRQCNDIGTVKIPNWLRQYTKKKIQIDTCSGREFPEDLRAYKVVIHCGGCMITQRDVQYRMKQASEQGVPFVNYGIVIAAMTGTLQRSIAMFDEVNSLLERER